MFDSAFRFFRVIGFEERERKSLEANAQPQFLFRCNLKGFVLLAVLCLSCWQICVHVYGGNESRDSLFSRTLCLRKEIEV
jgi:hypothetical protein